MTPKVLFITTFYPEFLSELYRQEPGLEHRGYAKQSARIADAGFGVGDAYASSLRQLGWDADRIICNADLLQQCWADEHGLSLDGNIHDRRRQIVAAQIRDHRPDVLFVFEWSPLGDSFLTTMKKESALLVGQMASPLRPERSYAPYDLMLSSWSPIVDYFRGIGIDAEPFRLGFDPRVLDRIKRQPPRYDVSFVGGFAPSHPNRVAWLENILKQVKVKVDVFGYGLDRVPEHSPIRDHHHGDVWGWAMYETLQQSRITLNLHAINDVRGRSATNIANNLRLYEATGVGTCLFTESKSNLPELFVPGIEVVTYDGSDDCIEKIRYYLDRESERVDVAAAGQRRTLCDHTWNQRMGELVGLLEPRLKHRVSSALSA